MNVAKNLIVGSVAAVLLTALLLFVFGGEGARLEQETVAQQGRSIARGAALYDAYCASCHGVRGGGRPGDGPPLNVNDLWDGRQGLSFYGSLHDYVYLTTSVGHPQEDMPVWSEELGGRLRADQIEDLTQFIMNWMGPQPQGVRPEIAEPIEEGDPIRGAEIFARNCSECHGPGAQGTSAAPSLITSRMAARSNSAFRLIINNGIPGTPMVPWAWDEILTPQAVEDVIAFLRSRQP